MFIIQKFIKIIIICKNRLALTKINLYVLLGKDMRDVKQLYQQYT